MVTANRLRTCTPAWICASIFERHRPVNRRYYKVALFLLCLLPLGLLVWQALQQDLGSNPVESLSHRTGDWALRFLLIVLAVTPLRRLTGWAELQQSRRMLGLFAFFYASVHFSVYALLDLGLDWSFLAADIAKRPYITVGFTAWVLLVPLAITSTRGMMRRLGRRWKQLHRLVYLIAVLGVVHYYWLVKADVREPLIYGAILALLLALRANGWIRRRLPAAARSTAG